MLIVLSPAKTLDFETPTRISQHSQPEFIAEAEELVLQLARISPSAIGSLMQISEPLAALNAARFASWATVAAPDNARQAMLAFNGDVYEGLRAGTFTTSQIGYAQTHIRILSGLYGLLRPLDLIQPYRLEMGTPLKTSRGNNLYAFWGRLITDALNRELEAHKTRVLVNLASEEYFRSVKASLMDSVIVTPVFEDWKDGRYKVISFFAKRARGLMARYAAQKRLKRAESLKNFDLEGYAFDDSASNDTSWIFRRKVTR
ncbi:MAG: hypothetical protein K0S28_1178 [Paucimonas sp.]|jgi:cytoplasmic iron level regulating protein YaaA (DUF328/UPF0246 family)|nr:hypothetical protein [Paucimonas sp.]